jgi:hypothetical protein
MLTNHHWLLPANQPTPCLPLPINPDKAFLEAIENAVPPATEEERLQLEQEMGFKYKQVMGELIYPCFKAQPDISPASIKLSQYMDNPAREHYIAIYNIAQYLAATISDGIYYWRQQPVIDLPACPIPQLHSDNHKVPSNIMHDTLFGFADSDWGSDKTHRKSITGIIVMFAHGIVGYKTKYQDTIAHSSTEAEFVADAAKLLLFFRSLLDDLGIPQDDATILYEDNKGALLMANAQQPTKRTRHMDIKHFSLLDWVDCMRASTIRDLDRGSQVPTGSIRDVRYMSGKSVTFDTRYDTQVSFVFDTRYDTR